MRRENLSVGKNTVYVTFNGAIAAGFSWTLPADLDDETLELRLYPALVNPASR
jgi:hypothetical protein